MNEKKEETKVKQIVLDALMKFKLTLQMIKIVLSAQHPNEDIDEQCSLNMGLVWLIKISSIR